MFYCRENELSKLNKRYEKNQFECIIIYGRRRVGKTSLINEFCRDKDTIYFSALDATAKENLNAFSKAIFINTNPNAIETPNFHSFDTAFDEVSRQSKEKRIVLVIDEYPYLAKADNSISSRLQHLIAHQWSNSNLFLILCGSSMSFMENQVLGYESPLYGRRTAQFKIEPLTYKETAVFHPDLSCEQNALIYGITGGVPHYINKLEIENNLDLALKENLFERSSYLFEEPNNLLKQELREPAVYNSVITAIAGGASKLNEIATKVGIETGPCAKYISVLIDLGILKKETPITEKIGKKSIYLIADNFFRFWYRFVPKNMASIQSGRIESIYDFAIKKDFSDYMGLVFEKMCQDYLLYYAKNLPIIIHDIGQWWGTDSVKRKQVQIDIIGTPIEGNEYIIASCKYKNEKIGVDELKLLQDYASVFGKSNVYHFFLFSKGGFTEELKQMAANNEVYLLTLDDIYK